MAKIIHKSNAFENGVAPFGDNARLLWELGLCPIPCRGDDGKRPDTYRWGSWKRRPGQSFLADMVQKHPAANIGILTGPLSKVTIVDVDDPGIVDAMIARFGDTPLVTSTPSGGVHLWYQHNCERSQNLRSDGLEIDIKGQGGFVVVPPSLRPSTGIPYRFERGSFDDLPTLPTIRPDAIPTAPAADVVGLRGIAKGRRNDTIFRRLLREVKHTDDVESLFDVARTINDEHTEEPLSNTEIGRIVESVWRIEATGNNWVGQEVIIPLTCYEIDLLSPSPNALTFWASVLRRHHWDRNRGPFALDCKSMAKTEVIKGWKDHRRYRSAIEDLIKIGVLFK